MRPNSLAEAVERAVDRKHPLYAHVNEFLDNFYEQPSERQRMIADNPRLLGVAEDDAWVGAVGEHLAWRWELVIPAWTDGPERFLDHPYYPGDLQSVEMRMIFLLESPAAFRRRNIFTEAEPLRRARMPQCQDASYPNRYR